MKLKGFLKLAAALIVIAAIIVLGIFGIGSDHVGGYKGIKLGLDLAGGVSITYETVGDDYSDTALSDTIYKMQLRAQAFSTEAQVYQEGTNRVTVSIPDVTDADAVLEGLGKAGNIFFIYGMGRSGVPNISSQLDEATGEHTFTLARSFDEIVADGDVVIDGSDIADAQANIISQNGVSGTENVVILDLNDAGKKKFADATAYCYSYRSSLSDENYLRNIIAIVYDGEVVNAPGVAAVISDGKATISGQQNFDESKQLATTIRIGALPVELSVLRYYVEGAQLGADALKTSLIAGAIGLALILLFMMIYYRIPGVASAIALVAYTGMLIVCLSIFGTVGLTLTLPGIAGIILSIGMAVDANVIIFTRIQEEIGTGKTVRSSIKIGFQKALSAIVDGNVTTIIAAIVLMILGSGTVKGFGQTLIIGIVLSMITALFVTKFILSALFDLGATKVGMYGSRGEAKKIHIVENFPKFICIFGAVVLVGIGAIIFNCNKIDAPFNYGLDFSGGTATSVTFEGEIPDDIQVEIESLVSSKLGINAEVSIVASENMVRVKTKELSTEQRAELADALKEAYGIKEEKITTESVGAAVSGEMKRDALIAVIVATICMLLYIWIRFKNFNFAASAVLALLHDVCVVLVLYAVCSKWISVGNTFIACMLTIVGYSINATIVIFDRIRENVAAKVGGKIDAELVNDSISQCMSRSINTSLTTFITVFILAILGVSSVKDFAIPLIVGIVCGTFSSVCVTGGLWFRLQSKLKAKQ